MPNKPLQDNPGVARTLQYGSTSSVTRADESSPTPSGLDEVIEDMKAAQQEELQQLDPKRNELEALEAQIAITEARAAKLARRVVDLDPDSAVGKGLQSEIDETNAKHKEQVRRRAELQKAIGERRLTDENIGCYVLYVRDVRDGMENATFDDQQLGLERRAVEIKVEDGEFDLNSFLSDWHDEIASGPVCRNPASTVDADPP